MFSTFLETLQDYWGKGFLLTVLIPTIIFAGINLAIGLALRIGYAQAWLWWATLPADGQIILLLSGLIGVAFLAFVIHNLQVAITRFFEGYWLGTPLVWLYHMRRDYYQREWCYLRAEVKRLDAELEQARNDAQAIDQICVSWQQRKIHNWFGSWRKAGADRAESSSHTNTPPITLQAIAEEKFNRWTTLFSPTREGYRRIQPTRLGNVLRASELYARDHYGIDAATMWNRLHPLLPEVMKEILQSRKIAMDFMLLMSLYAALITFIWSPLIVYFTNNWLLFLLSAAGIPLAWLCYRTAVQSALAYGEQLRAVYDLYRYELLHALHIQIPTNPDEERLLWRELSQIFQRNAPPASPYQFAIDPAQQWRYMAATEPPPPDPTGWQRMRRAITEFLRGFLELFQPNEQAKP